MIVIALCYILYMKPSAVDAVCVYRMSPRLMTLNAALLRREDIWGWKIYVPPCLSGLEERQRQHKQHHLNCMCTMYKCLALMLCLPPSCLPYVVTTSSSTCLMLCLHRVVPTS